MEVRSSPISKGMLSKITPGSTRWRPLILISFIVSAEHNEMCIKESIRTKKYKDFFKIKTPII